MNTIELLTLIRESPCKAMLELSRLFVDADFLANCLYTHGHSSVSKWIEAANQSAKLMQGDVATRGCERPSSRYMKVLISAMDNNLDIWSKCHFSEADCNFIVESLNNTESLLAKLWEDYHRREDAKKIENAFRRKLQSQKVTARLNRRGKPS